MPTTKKWGNIFLKMHPLHRVVTGVIVSAVTYLLIRNHAINSLLQLMILWDVFAFSYIITCWIVFVKRPTMQIRDAARQEDGSTFFAFMIILVSSFAGMFTVMLLVVSKEAARSSGLLYLLIAIAGMLLSWVMVHTTFAFHYAHLYYNDHKSHPKNAAEGLVFPQEKYPDYLDFAYFSFVIGMTFQVSDVEITSRQIRRIALVHGLLSFGLNTFVVALTINIVAGLQS